MFCEFFGKVGGDYIQLLKGQQKMVWNSFLPEKITGIGFYPEFGVISNFLSEKPSL